MRQCYLLGTARRLLGDYAAEAELFAEAAGLLDTRDPWARPWEWIFPGDLAVDEGRYARAPERPSCTGRRCITSSTRAIERG